MSNAQDGWLGCWIGSPRSNRMLKMSASFVLASLRGSTYRSVRLASSLAAAALDGHFEHPAWVFCSCHRRTTLEVLLCRNSVSVACSRTEEP